MYIRTYVCTYVRTYVRMYVGTYVRTYVRTYIRTYIRMYVPTYLRTYLRTHTGLKLSGHKSTVSAQKPCFCNFEISKHGLESFFLEIHCANSYFQLRVTCRVRETGRTVFLESILGENDLTPDV